MHRLPGAPTQTAPSAHPRPVSTVLLQGQLEVPAPPPALVADWQRDISGLLGLEPGDVESLSLARARRRWPDYRRCVEAVADWLGQQGLHGVLADAAPALMACRGARTHHDGAQYGDYAFCNLFLREDQGLDLLFTATGQRISLRQGTVVLFDTWQPHSVLLRGQPAFAEADFAADIRRAPVFLTWELPLRHAPLAQRLGLGCMG